MDSAEPDSASRSEHVDQPLHDPHRHWTRSALRSRRRRHPALPARSELTLGERAADSMRNRMGSWGFVFGFVIFLLAWVLANSVFLIGGGGNRHSFDPYPYILLNLFLSMLAAIQGAILLIAAKRADQIAGLLAEHDYETNLQAFDRIQAIQERLGDLAESNRKLLEQNSAILRHTAGSLNPGTGDEQPM